MLITKADGTQEEFKPGKLRHSLKKAGASEAEIEEVLLKIEETLVEGMTTQKIYREAFSLLQETHSPVIASRYSLRRAILNLGPTGFPFEDFLSRLFESKGYSTKVGIEIAGKCAVHEIDLAAFKADHSFVAEAKFHSRPGIKSDLQVAMYSYARLLDLSERRICSDDICGVKNLKIITNTKFTSAATNYANCVGIELLSWNYPKENNLFTMIEESGLYPVTALQTISNSQKALLLENNIIVCGDILKNLEVLNMLGLSDKKMETLLSEARQLSVG